MASTQIFDLPAASTIAECGSLLASLRKLIEEHDDIRVTCEAVEQADLAALQVLMSARKTALRDGKSFSVVATETGTFGALLKEYGVSFA